MIIWNSISTVLSIYLIIINVIGFFVMGVDKQKAKNHEWRIQEKTLFLIAAIGGSIGVLFGMHKFRHKTKHLKFVYGVPFIIFFQILLITGIFYYMHK